MISRVSKACPKHKIIDHHSCENTDMCLRIKTGNVTDYARLFYSSRPHANQMILHGYLICGGDGVSVTGKTSAFEGFHITFISSRPRDNSRFYVNKTGQTSPVLLKNTMNSFDDNDDNNDIDERRHFNEQNVNHRSTEFDSKYPELPKSGYILDIIAFYDNAFWQACNQNGSNPSVIIEKIFNYVDEFFRDESLGTKISIRLKRSVYKPGVIWSNARANGSEASLKRLRFYDEENANMYAYLGVLGSDDSNLGKAPKIGKCLNSECSGVCSDHGHERTFVAECDLSNLHIAAWVISHEIGHLLGMRHDFDDNPPYGYKNSVKGVDCYGLMSNINYKNLNNLKWSECSSEYLRMYHKDAHKVLPTFCLNSYAHIKYVEAIDGNALNLTCDTSKCNNILHVKWYSKISTPIGYHSPEFGDTEVKPPYNRTMRILQEDGKVTLEISKYASEHKGIYCKVDTIDTEPYCETKQKFDTGIS